MRNKNIRHLFLWCICCLLFPLHSCNDVDDLQAQANLLKERVATLEKAVEHINESVNGLQYLLSGTSVVGVTAIDKGYKLELADGQSFNIVTGENVDGLLPLIKISDEGYWMYSVDGTNYTPMTDGSGKPLSVYPVNEDGGRIVSPQMRVSSDGYWQVSYDGGETYETLVGSDGRKVSALVEVTSSNSIFDRVHYDEKGKPEITLRLAADGKEFTFPVISTFYLKVLADDGSEITEADEQIFPLAEKRVYTVEQGDVEEAVIKAPEGWDVILEEAKLSITSPKVTDVEKTEEINIIITSPKNFIRVVTIKAKLLNSYGTSQTWLDFEGNTGNNVLLDFSYAGYEHGEKEPPSVETLQAQGYKIYNVVDYGAVPNDGLSDREAFVKTLEAATGVTRSITKDNNIRVSKDKANAIIYFPEGEFVLQGVEDKVNECIHLTMGNFVIKGAGRNKTVIRMNKQNEPAGAGMWTTPTLIEIKHYTDASDMTPVTEDAAKGTFSVKVGAATGITAGSWVRLYLKNNNTELVGKELSPYAATDLSTQNDVPSIVANGVEVLDYHQVKSVSGNTITFYEPLMHSVEAKYEWKIQKYPHYENVGVEDITFQGDAKEDFKHHASAADDSGFKLIDFGRLTNSWMRRVNFISVSEALSVVNSANVSVYDIDISGKRGHSAVRSQGSSRVFIGKVRDRSDGKELKDSGGHELGNFMKNAGQYHACGVSKQSLGAVIWNVHWGDDSCFESHASQPRATLIDCCTGGFMQWREGGDLTQLPNHLDDLVIWNMNATKTKALDNNPFVWWDENNIWWKNLPPVIVGFHGAQVQFADNSKQVKRLESNGTAVTPNSLYEAQLKKRLGEVPSWLNALK
jgi:hypothetical protein